MTTIEEPSSVKNLKELLRRTLRITTTDGRIFLGTFVGTDTQLNILLASTDEFRLAPLDSVNLDGRFVGLVMIPRRLVVKIEVHGRNTSEGGKGELAVGGSAYA